MTIIERVEKMREEFHLPVLSFCRCANISPTLFYGWRSGSIKPSDKTLARIDDYLRRYNF